MLTFLQLSDIHFSSRREGSPHELDLRLRHGVEKDAVAYARSIGGVSAILVCGDVAYSGDPTQYAKAAAWLRNLSPKLGIGPQDIWVIPGNHDVDRARTDSPQQRHMRAVLRLRKGAELDREIERILADGDQGPALFEPLAQYNLFAAQFGCDVSADSPFWTQEFPLEGPFRLCLRGMTSTLVSDAHDDTDANRLVVGTMQVGILLEDHAVHATLCHHPYRWLHDADEIRPILNGGAALQVTGHSHAHDLRDTEAGWHLETGALQPDRREDPWEPRYNFISCVVEENDPAALVLRVHPRVWTGLRFERDPAYEKGFSERRISLPVSSKPSSQPASTPGTQAARLHDRTRDLLHRTALLPSGDRFRAAETIGLKLGDVAALPPHQIPRYLVDQADATGLLRELWTAVEELHGSQSGPPNPFSHG